MPKCYGAKCCCGATPNGLGMIGQCPGVLLVMGLFFAGMGLFTIALAVATWLYPNSSFVERNVYARYRPRAEADAISRFLGLTREQAGPMNLWSTRLIGPFFGAAFFMVGVALTSSEVRCAIDYHQFPPLIGPLEFRFWPPMTAFMAVAVVIGASRAWRRSPLELTLTLLWSACWSFAAGEAAAFHTGVQAERWGAIAVVVFVFGALAAWFATMRRQ